MSPLLKVNLVDCVILQEMTTTRCCLTPVEKAPPSLRWLVCCVRTPDARLTLRKTLCHTRCPPLWTHPLCLTRSCHRFTRRTRPRPPTRRAPRGSRAWRPPQPPTQQPQTLTTSHRMPPNWSRPRAKSPEYGRWLTWPRRARRPRPSAQAPPC